MRQTGFLAVIAICAGTVALAQDYPQLHAVQDVGADDVLNIRNAPGIEAEVIGSLAADSRGVEVVATNPEGTWGRVNIGEGSGWASLRYLAPQGIAIDNYNLPVGLSCFGTEPFWSLTNADGALQFDTPDMAPRDLDIWMAQDSGIAGDFRRMIQLAGIGGPGTAFLYPAICSDGMSDRVFGLAISVMTAPDAPLLSGCCSLSR